MTAGEVLEHTCPPYVPPKKSFPWGWVIAGIIAALLILAGCLYFFCQKKPKVKKTRAVKVEPKKDEPVPVMQYFVPQPTVMVQQPVIQQVQQPVVYQQVQQPVREVVQQPQYAYTQVSQVATPVAAPVAAAPMPIATGGSVTVPILQ